MKRLAELLGDLAAAPHADARERRLRAFFDTPFDEDTGWAVGWLTGAIKPPRQTPAKLRALAETRVDAELFRLSAAALGDVAETAALIWPGGGDQSISAVADPGASLPALLDRLDAEARVALVRLHTGRKSKGAYAREVYGALGSAHDVDPALIAGAVIEGAPPYPRLVDWLSGGGAAPNWSPPEPPHLKRISAVPTEPYVARTLPDGEPVGVESGRAFAADGAERKLAEPTPDGWGFYLDGKVTDPLALHATADPHAAHQMGATLLVHLTETNEWVIWPADARRIICPVTFIEAGRTVNVTLGVMLREEVAPLIKLPVPDGAKVSAFARKAVIDKFGPVRQVGPGLWAEVAYTAIRPAPRRKIGVTLEGAEITRLIWGEGPATPDLGDIN